MPELLLPESLIAAGLSWRPLSLVDSRAVVDVVAAQERLDVGEVVIEEADVVADWQRPSYDVATRTVGVFDGEQLIACGELSHPDRAEIAVHPDHRGRGLGTALATWSQQVARSLGASVVGTPVPQGSPGDALLAELGYHVRWTSWVLELPAGASVPERPLPAGYVARAATTEEHRAVWTLNEDAFLEWSARERESFEDWRGSTVLRPGFEPWQLRVVADPRGEVVAMALVQVGGEDRLEGWVARLATRADQRGRGLAQALLVDAFARAREHGATRSALSTDSRTGALGLYEKVGMVVTSTWLSRALTLT